MLAASDGGGSGRRRWWLSTAPTGRLERRPAAVGAAFTPATAPAYLPPAALSQLGRMSDAHARVRPSLDPSATSTSKHSNGRLGVCNCNLDVHGRADADCWWVALCARSGLFAWESAADSRKVSALRTNWQPWSACWQQKYYSAPARKLD